MAPAPAPTPAAAFALPPAVAPVAAPAGAAPAVPAPTPGVAVVVPAHATTPYRVYEAPPAFAPFAARAPGGRVPWPTIGPVLTTYGALLWSFIVAGQFTTSWMTGGPMSQGTAVLIVFVATFAAWVAGLRASRLASPPRSIVRLFGRGFAIGALAFLCFFFTVLAATVASAASSKSHDFLLAFVMVLFAVAAAVIGPRVTWPSRPEPTQRQRYVRVSLWIGGTLMTLLAAAELGANG